MGIGSKLFDHTARNIIVAIWLVTIVLPFVLAFRWIWLGLPVAALAVVVSFFTISLQVELSKDRNWKANSMQVTVLQIGAFVVIVGLAWMLPMIWIETEFFWLWTCWISWIATGTFLGGLLGSLMASFPEETY